MGEPEQAVAEAPEQPAKKSKPSKKPADPKEKGRGRPPKLKEECIKIMSEQFELGMSARYVCQYVLVAGTTFYHWVRLAEADIAAGIKPNWKRGRYVQFLQSIMRAQATFMSHNLAKLQKEPDHHAAEWLLERKAPEEWGKKDRQSEEVPKPRQAVALDAEPNPIHAVLDEAKHKDRTGCRSRRRS